MRIFRYSLRQGPWRPMATPQQLSDRQLLILAFSKLPADYLLKREDSKDEDEHTPNSVLELGDHNMFKRLFNALPESEVELREQLSKRMGRCSSAPAPPRQPAAPPVAPPVLAPCPTVKPVVKHGRTRRAAIRLGTNQPTELEQALESAIDKMRRWWNPSSEQRVCRRRSADDARLTHPPEASSSSDDTSLNLNATSDAPADSHPGSFKRSQSAPVMQATPLTLR